jgi:2-methylcitrate dehydratase PrpD
VPCRDLGAIEERDLERARQCVLDWITAAVAGAQEPAARMLQAVVSAEGCTPRASVLGTSLRTGAQAAALANGVSAHSLELDDVARWMTGHPGASICSAVFALAEARSLASDVALASVVTGYDVACRIALALGSGHGEAGWHATGTVGTFGVAAACARLLGLDEAATDHALGLAATQAGGLNAAIGSMGKALNAGRAAANGLSAALLAEQGFSGPADAVERFASVSTTTYDPGRAARVMGDERGIRSVVFKRFACCGLAIPAAAGILELRDAHDVTSETVRHVTLQVPQHTLVICSVTSPGNAVESRFSLPFVAAAALADRVRGLSAFSDEGARDTELVALQARVSVGAHDRPDQATDITVELENGRRLLRRREPDLPADDHQLEAQWRMLAARAREIVAPLLGPDVCDQLVATARSLDGHTPVGQLLGLARR